MSSFQFGYFITFTIKVVVFLTTVDTYGEFDGAYMKKDTLFTAIADLEPLVYLENLLFDDLKYFIRAEQRRLDELKQFINQMEKNGIERTDNDTLAHYATHPSSGFSLLGRYMKVWPNISERFTQNEMSKDALGRLNKNLKKYSGHFPEDDDVQGSIWALFRLQDTYQLSESEITRGLGPNQQNLTVEELFEIGYLAASAADYYHAVGWFRESYRQFPKGAKQVGFLDIGSLLEYLAWSEYQVGNLEDAIKYAQTVLRIDPRHVQARTNIEYWQQDLEDSKRNPSIRKKAILKTREWAENYSRICRGKAKMSSKDSNKLYCKYVAPHPSLILKPRKLELAFMDPRIEIYHDMLSETDILEVMQISTPKLKRATIHHPKTGRLAYADYRVSESAWLDSSEYSVVNKINKSIEALIGLDLRYCEALQVVNYGIGGQYEPHFDFAVSKKSHVYRYGMGNRIATVLFYLSNVEKGGHTVFLEPDIRASIPPLKGSMIFWYNLKKSGEGDKRTKHAACPVLVGQKWVANLWIHEYGQEFRRQCGLTKDAV